MGDISPSWNEGHQTHRVHGQACLALKQMRKAAPDFRVVRRWSHWPADGYNMVLWDSLHRPWA